MWNLVFQLGRTMRHHGAKLIIELLENESLLAAIKVFCDWLAWNKRLLQMLLPVFSSLSPFCKIISLSNRSLLVYGRN